jgi:hypothetical protein
MLQEERDRTPELVADLREREVVTDEDAHEHKRETGRFGRPVNA